jgi:CRP/FNR family transcriptional regulator, cyclic AMP receptor protein
MSQEFDPVPAANRLGPNTKLTLQPGQHLFGEGDRADALYIVSHGTLQIVSGATVYEIVKTGGIVGEMAIVDEGMPRSASVVATTYAELIKLDTAQFLELVMEAPDFALTVMRVMARRLRRMNERGRA